MMNESSKIFPLQIFSMIHWFLSFSLFIIRFDSNFSQRIKDGWIFFSLTSIHPLSGWSYNGDTPAETLRTSNEDIRRKLFSIINKLFDNWIFYYINSVYVSVRCLYPQSHQYSVSSSTSSSEKRCNNWIIRIVSHLCILVSFHFFFAAVYCSLMRTPFGYLSIFNQLCCNS